MIGSLGVIYGIMVMLSVIARQTSRSDPRRSSCRIGTNGTVSLMHERQSKEIIDLLWLIVVLLVIIAGILAGLAWRFL